MAAKPMKIDIAKAPDASRVARADARRTERVKRLYRKMFGRAFPKGWKVLWHVYGLTVPDWKTVLLGCESMYDPMDFETVVHELLHVRHPEWPHGETFDTEMRRLLKELKR